MDLYDVPLSVSLLGFGLRTMLANFHMGGTVLLLSSLKLAREECKSNRPYVF